MLTDARQIESKPGFYTRVNCCKEIVPMKWMIVTDSSCDLKNLDGAPEDVQFATVPFQMTLDGENYTDDDTLDVQAMVDAMEQAKVSHSACPSPEAWVEQFERADCSIAFTISSRLSGSFNSAMAAKGMVLEKYPEKKIEVVDALSTGPKLVLLARMASRMIGEQAKLPQITAACREFAEKGKTVFTLSSFHNLVINGRVNKVAGFIAGKLNIRVIGIGTEEGRIQLKELIRGEKRALRTLLENMEKDGYRGKPMAVSQCLAPQLAADLKTLITEKWPEALVEILPTRGLDSYYAERNGLILSYPV